MNSLETKVRKSIDKVRKSMELNRPPKGDFLNLENDSHKKFAFSLSFFGLTLRSLGVIYGDIGTSPLYVMFTIFTSPPAPQDVIGGVSLVIWSLLILVTFKYVIFILQANNGGEGGTFALGSLLVSKDSDLSPRWKAVAIMFSLFGAALVIGDGALTPAVSVLSAIEGLAVFDPNDLSPGSAYTQLISIVIIVLLFMFQRFGTSKVGVSFGPIMLIWFATLFISGLYRVTTNPAIFSALDPWEGLSFLINNGENGFLTLGGVFLAVTGLEALYADLGHFGAASIRCSWLFIVLPSLILNYLGQGALLLTDNTTITNPFFLMVPTSLFWPLFIIATLATIIASQAMITGCFSLVSQAISLGFFPPVLVKHTSKQIIGQIYIPVVNFFLMILTILVIVGFNHAGAITQAYGVTVCSVMCITSIMFMAVMRFSWHSPLWKVLPFFLFLIVDLFFFASNLTKIPNGGWVSILFGSFFSSLMLIWYYGENQLKKKMASTLQASNISELKKALKERLGVDDKVEPESEKTEPIQSITFKTFTLREEELPEDNASDSSSQSGSEEGSNAAEGSTAIVVNDRVVLPTEITRVPGMGVFLSSSRRNVPTVFQMFANYIHGVPETIVFLTVETVSIPIVPEEYKIEITNYGSGIHRVLGRFGYSENPIKIADVLEKAFANGLVKRDYTVFFNAEHIHVRRRNIFLNIVLRIYAVLKRFFAGTLNNFKLPSKNVMAVGVQVEL